MADLADSFGQQVAEEVADAAEDDQNLKFSRKRKRSSFSAGPAMKKDLSALKLTLCYVRMQVQLGNDGDFRWIQGYVVRNQGRYSSFFQELRAAFKEETQALNEETQDLDLDLEKALWKRGSFVFVPACNFIEASLACEHLRHHLVANTKVEGLAWFPLADELVGLEALHDGRREAVESSTCLEFVRAYRGLFTRLSSYYKYTSHGSLSAVCRSIAAHFLDDGSKAGPEYNINFYHLIACADVDGELTCYHPCESHAFVSTPSISGGYIVEDRRSDHELRPFTNLFAAGLLIDKYKGDAQEIRWTQVVLDLDHIVISQDRHRHDGHVYVIELVTMDRDVGPFLPKVVKVGKSINPENRLNTLQTGNPVEMSLLHCSRYLADALKCERKILKWLRRHNKVVSQQMGGGTEWFTVDEEQLGELLGRVDES